MSSLAAALAAQPVAQRGSKCTVCALLARLDKADKDALAEALAAYDTITGAAISRALKSEGHDASAGSIQRHRRGDCKNERR